LSEEVVGSEVEDEPCGRDRDRDLSWEDGFDARGRREWSVWRRKEGKKERSSRRSAAEIAFLRARLSLSLIYGTEELTGWLYVLILPRHLLEVDRWRLL